MSEDCMKLVLHNMPLVRYWSMSSGEYEKRFSSVHGILYRAMVLRFDTNVSGIYMSGVVCKKKYHT